MPKIEGRGPFHAEPCGTSANCTLPAGVRVSGADEIRHRCPNHASGDVDVLLDVPCRSGHCVACGRGADDVLALDAVDYRADFCRTHARQLVWRALEPDACRRLVRDAGGDPEAVFMLHGDFYDPETGVALQPISGREGA